MRIYYVGNIRIPTEKAHGLTIAKSCEAFARAGADVVLVVPRRKTHLEDDVFGTYGVEKNFTVAYLPTLDALRYSSSRWAYWLSAAAFYLSARFYFMRVAKEDAVLYTREAPLLSVAGSMPAFLECHHVFTRSTRYFSLARRARGVVTISHALKDKFVAAGFAKARLIVAPSGVDLSVFGLDTPQEKAREALTLPQDTIILLYTGNFTTMGEDKGIRDILRALKALPDVLFVAVGGSGKDIARYMKEADGLGVLSRVKFAGFQSQKTLALYQRAADALLMPFPDTLHYRSNMSPVKMFEYMASGRPIIASDLPTIREVLNETNAVLVSPGDPQVLAAAVQNVLADHARIEKLAAQALIDGKRFSWDERAQSILKFVRAKTESK